jgi:hypothetical protein
MGWSLEQSPMKNERERRGPGAVQIEREGRGPEQVRWHGGDFFGAGVLFKILSWCCRLFQIFFGSSWLRQPIEKRKT